MPMARAASAGKVDVRSGDVVKMIEPTSSKSLIPLARSSSSNISRVAAWISAGTSFSTVVAPRIPRTPIFRPIRCVLVSLAEDSLRRRPTLRLSSTTTLSTGPNGKHVLIDFGSMGYKHTSVVSSMEIMPEFPVDGADSTLIDCRQEGPAHGCDSGSTGRQFGR